MLVTLGGEIANFYYSQVSYFMKTAGFRVLEGRLENFPFLLFKLCTELRRGEEYLELREMR
jgi:hypothetical protein